MKGLRINSNLVRTLMIYVSLLQLLAICVFVWSIYMSLNGFYEFFGIIIIDLWKSTLYLIISIVTLIIVMLYLIYELIKLSNLEKKIEIMRTLNESSEEAIKLLRCHRHDFLNHLQVILGYLHFNKTQEIKNYIKDLNENLNEIRKISGLEMPQLSMILLTKKEEANSKGIKLNYSLDVNSLVMINQVDLVRILTNLIDNAIFELSKASISLEKIITVIITSDKDKLKIVVHNTNSIIEDKRKIFEYGFTTKGNKGSGLGLYTIKNIVENKYKGKIDVNSDEEEGTRFEIVI